MKFSQAKYDSLTALITHSGPNGKGKPMWCEVTKIGKSNTVLSLHTAGCLLVNDKNPRLVRVTDGGRRQLQAWRALLQEAENARLRERHRIAMQERRARGLTADE